MNAYRYKLRRFIAVLKARNREFWRDRTALAWNVLFPLLVVFGFAIAFAGKGPDMYKVGVIDAGDMPQAGFYATRYIRFIPVEDREAAVDKVRRHQLDMLLDETSGHYWINETSPNGYMLERVLLGSPQGSYVKQTVSGEAIRYVDWLVPGVFAMNIMFSALFGVGYVIVRYRKNGVLKRLKATPVTAFEFLSAQITSRLWLLIAVTAAVYLITDLAVGFTMNGNYLTLLLVFVLGTFSLISMGLVVAARLSSEEGAQGVLNLLSWPMMFLSGVWFSLEGTSAIVRYAAQIFPLTHMIDAARAVMIDGAGIVQILPQLLILAGMSALFLAIGAWSFRWK